MAFLVTRVGYRDFRNMRELVLEPGPRLTVLVGRNAVGKTNCIEGLQILTAGMSFRHASPAALVRQSAETAALRMHVESEKRALDIGYDLFPSKKLLSINGKRRPVAEGRGILPSVLFYPDELMAVKGGAALRRDLIDAFGVQLNRAYAKLASDYRRALMQRNRLMKASAAAGERPDETMLASWTDMLVEAGSLLFLYREALVRRLKPHVERIYAELADGEKATMVYKSDYADMVAIEIGMVNNITTSPDPVCVSSSNSPCLTPLPSTHARREAVRAALRARLDAVRADELRRCQTLAGPHLDDLAFSVEGRPAREFASQGQQRTFVLAVKLAQVELTREMQGQYPLFLLDDVMSELDAHRRSRLFDLIQGGMQTVVTTTNLDYFRAEELAAAKVVRLGDGA